MTKKLKETTMLNVICSLISQVVAILSGFFLPKLILSNFGSEVNGLVSSITQFLSYISLIEGGVSGVVVASMYKPLCNKDDEKLSSVVRASDKFYKKIALILTIYAIILAFVYPVIFDVNFSYTYVLTLVLILSLNSLIQYNFSISMKLLLNADKKVYIVSIVHSLATVLTLALAYISVKIYPNIHFFKIMTTAGYIIQPIAFNIIVRKKYNINKNVKADSKLLKSRWNGFAINIASFIHFNTDIVLLTIFTDLETVSVYSVYSLVITGLQTLIVAITSGVSPTMGHLYVKEDNEKLSKKFELYEFWMFFIISIIFSVTVLLITPFVMIYTKNIADANYYQPLFGILMVVSEIIYLIKFPHMDLAYAANRFKDITPHAYIEAALNIIVSLIFVKKYGLVGVAIGTIVGMLYRLIYHVIYLKREILNRKISIFLKKVFVFSIFSLLGILLCNLIMPKVEYNVINWIYHGCVYSVIIFVSILTGCLMFYKEDLHYLNRYVKKLFVRKSR